jgi:hypothetical protein
MAGTFSGATIVPTGSAKNPVKLESDSITPNLGALPATRGAMTSDTGLPPTNGVDCKLIHGNFWESVNGQERIEVSGDVTTDISGNETRNVSGNQTYTITGDINETIVGTSSYTYVGVQNNTYSSTVTNDYAAVQQTSQPTSFLNYLQSQSTVGWYLGSYIMFYFQISGTVVQMQLAQLGVSVPMNCGLAGYTFNAAGAELKAKGFEEALAGFFGRLVGLKTEDGGPEIKLVAISINTILIGINQFF